MSSLIDLVLDFAKAEHLGVPLDLTDKLTQRYDGPDARWLPQQRVADELLIMPFLPGTFEQDDGRSDRLSAFEVRQRVSRRKLRDISTLRLTAEGLSRTLRQMAGAGREGLEDLHEICGLLDPAPEGDQDVSGGFAGLRRKGAPSIAAYRLEAGIASLAREFSTLATAAPEIVRLAFQGRLFEAAAQVQSFGYRLADGRMSRKVVLDMLEALGRFHLAESLLIAADDAARRVFETTGFSFLDENGGSKTTKGCILKRMERQLDLLLQALKLYARKRDIPLDEPAAGPFANELLLSTCSRLEEALFRIHGDQTGAVLEATLKSLRRRIVLFRRALKTLKGQISFRKSPAWEDRGPNPFQMLWLNASIATGWLDVRHHEAKDPDEKGLSDDARDRQILRHRITRLRFALDEAAAGRFVEPKLHHASTATLAGRLYFTLRHVEVQDPDSIVAKRVRNDKELSSMLDAFRTVHAEHSAQHAGQEPWAAEVSTKAKENYEAAIKRRGSDRLAEAFAAEAEGTISIRLKS